MLNFIRPKRDRRVISLPMYDVEHPATLALTRELARRLQRRGFTEQQTRVVWPDDLAGHWQSQELLLSQTCGYPLVTLLDSVRTIGCFHYTAAGCQDYRYRSLYVVRDTDRQRTVADYFGQRLVCNSADSQSGYNVWVRRLANQKSSITEFFSEVHFSGGHRQSLMALQQQTADITAVDCVSLALFSRYHPQWLHGLTVIEQSPLTPSLPLIASAQVTDQQVQLLRQTLTELVADPLNQPLCAPLFIGGFSEISREAYQGLIPTDRPLP